MSIVCTLEPKVNLFKGPVATKNLLVLKNNIISSSNNSSSNNTSNCNSNISINTSNKVANIPVNKLLTDTNLQNLDKDKSMLIF